MLPRCRGLDCSDPECAGPHVAGGHDFDAVAKAVPLPVGLEQGLIEPQQFRFACQSSSSTQRSQGLVTLRRCTRLRRHASTSSIMPTDVATETINAMNDHGLLRIGSCQTCHHQLWSMRSLSHVHGAEHPEHPGAYPVPQNAPCGSSALEP